MEAETIVRLIFVVALGMLSLVVVLLVFMHFAKVRVFKERLKRQHLVADHKKELLQHSLLAQEEERDRLSAELHDGVTSKLSAIHMQLGTLHKGLPPELSDRMRMVREALQTSVEDTRRISHDLFPLVLERFGLATALEELSDLHRLTGIAVELETDLDDDAIPMARAIHVYRIVQELVHNSIKHGQSTAMSIRLAKAGEGYRLTYADNGHGKVENLQSADGLGLKNIRTRLSVLNGEMQLHQLQPGLEFGIEFDG